MEKWLRAAEAADSAIQVCLMNGKHLVTDQTAATELQGYMLNIENSTAVFNYVNDEALFLVKKNVSRNYDPWYFTLPNITTDPNHLLVGTCVSPSMKMVEMFYTDNGLPIDQDPSWNSGSRYAQTEETDPYYTDVVVLNEPTIVLHTRREPRFYADIATDRSYWRLGMTVNNLYKVEAYRGETFGLKENRINSTLPQNLSGYWLKKWSASKAELYNYQSSVNALGDNPFPVIRMAELYLIAAEAWNEYLDAPDYEHVYAPLDVVRERAGLEGIQLTYTSYANNPNKINTKAGMREIIQREWNIEFAFEGRRFWNLRRWLTAQDELNEAQYGWSILGSNAEQFYNNYEGPVSVWTQRSFLSPRDYLFPIRSEDIMTTGCVQNPGW